MASENIPRPYVSYDDDIHDASRAAFEELQTFARQHPDISERILSEFQGKDTHDVVAASQAAYSPNPTPESKFLKHWSDVYVTRSDFQLDFDGATNRAIDQARGDREKDRLRVFRLSTYLGRLITYQRSQIESEAN